MACCTNKLIWRSMVSVPPDITTPDENIIGYLYNVFIRGDLYDIFNDTYDSIDVDGINYASSTAILNDLIGFNAVTPVLTADLTAAGIYDGVSNDFGYIGFDSSGGVTNNYILTIVTDTPHTIVVNLTLAGNPVSIPLQGGAYAMTDYCITTNVVDAAVSDDYNFDLYDETGTVSPYMVTTVNITNPAVALTNISSYLNTIAAIIPLNVTYTDNGNGTYTHLITVPTINITPNNVTGTDIGTESYTPC